MVLSFVTLPKFIECLSRQRNNSLFFYSECFFFLAQVDRLTGDKSELELELVRLAEAKQRVEAKVAASRTRTDDLELSRRASDAKATSHLDRAKRLHEEAEVSSSANESCAICSIYKIRKGIV
jgi:hypothetical protein